MNVWILKEDGTIDCEYEVPTDPLEKSILLFPSITFTDIPPPSVLSNEVAIFKDGKWHVKINLTGTKYWIDGIEFQIDRAVDDIPENASLTPPVTVPYSISAAQGHLALIEFGLYQAAIDFIKAIPDQNTKLKSEVNFYRRNDWQRDNQVLLDLAQGLGITNEQLDKMFIFASTQ